MSQSSASVWSGLASWYDALVEGGSGPHETAVAALLALVPRPPGDRVLDVGCGQGRATRALGTTGAAEIVGIDASQSMIEIAQARTDPDAPITWRVDDAESLDSCQSGSFDGVTCQLALMDIADFRAAIASIRRVLRPGRWFVFVIGHPCFLAPDAVVTSAEGQSGCLVTRYLNEEFWRSANPNGVRGRAGNHHRPLSAYLNALLAAACG